MIARLPFLAPLLLVSTLAVAQGTPAYPPGAEAREAKLLAKYGPRTRAWIRHEAQREAAMPQVSAPMTANAVRQSASAFDNPRPSNADVDEIVFLVMMQTSRDAQEDLRTMASGVNAINRQKEALRAAHATKVRPPSEPQRAAPRYREPVTPRPLPKATFEARLAGAKNSADSLNEMGEMESLRLQMAMDRLSKMMATLSNLLKKESDTARSITQNIK